MSLAASDPVPALVAALRERTGLQIDEHHRGRVAELLADTPHRAGRGSLGDTALYDALVDAVTIDETYFFRHRHQLQYLRTEILPALLAIRGPDHVLQVWSAGCANGAEPYTLAAILGEEGLAQRADVLGTDISAAAIAQAQEATYSRWTRRSPELASRPELFTSATSRRATLSPELVGRVTLRQHNLLHDEYPRPTAGAGFDVVLCRNVLLHLTPDAVATVVPRLVDALAPGGWLITAPADPPLLGLPGTNALRGIALPAGGLVHQRVVDDRRDEPAPARRAAPRPTRSRRRRAHPPTRAQPTDVSPHATAPPSVEEGRLRCARARRLLADGAAESALADATAAVFLAPDLAVAHLTLGMAARECGRLAVAARSFRRAGELLEQLPADTTVELADGETAGNLADLARAHALLAQEAGG